MYISDDETTTTTAIHFTRQWFVVSIVFPRALDDDNITRLTWITFYMHTCTYINILRCSPSPAMMMPRGQRRRRRRENQQRFWYACKCKLLLLLLVWLMFTLRILLHKVKCTEWAQERTNERMNDKGVCANYATNNIKLNSQIPDEEECCGSNSRDSSSL